MLLTLAIPDEFVERLNADGGDAARRVLESFAVEEYRLGRLSGADLLRLLGFETRNDLDGFLKKREVFLDYDEAALMQDRSDLKNAGF